MPFNRVESAGAPSRHKGVEKLQEYFEMLEHAGWVTTLSGTGWMYQAVEITHYFSLFILVGTNVIVDLRVLGVAARRQSVPQIAEQLFPWVWTALTLALVSGFLMFTTGAGDYYADTVFRVKMSVILLAIASTIIVQRNAARWDWPTANHTWFKIAAFASLFFWIGSILAGVEIAAISGLG
jgi:hypothetical protein